MRENLVLFSVFYSSQFHVLKAIPTVVFETCPIFSRLNDREFVHIGLCGIIPLIFPEGRWSSREELLSEVLTKGQSQILIWPLP